MSNRNKTAETDFVFIFCAQLAFHKIVKQKKKKEKRHKIKVLPAKSLQTFIAFGAWILFKVARLQMPPFFLLVLPEKHRMNAANFRLSQLTSFLKRKRQQKKQSALLNLRSLYFLFRQITSCSMNWLNTKMSIIFSL